jgi:hypothetical protein
MDDEFFDSSFGRAGNLRIYVDAFIYYSYLCF